MVSSGTVDNNTKNMPRVASHLRKFNGTIRVDTLSDHMGIWLQDQITEQLKYELHLHSAKVPTRDKLVLVLIEMLGLGCLGLDRCYTGQVCLGAVKGLTAGGLLVWAFVDYVAIVLNCLGKSPQIKVIGYDATFTPSGVRTAYWVTLVLLIISLCCGAYITLCRARKNDSTVEAEAFEETGTPHLKAEQMLLKSARQG